MNSTSFLEAAAERRGFGRGGVRWESGSGGLSRATLESGPVITTSGIALEGWSFREELEEEEETEGARFGKDGILEDGIVHGGADEALRRVGWEPASNDRDKRRGELEMSNWISGFSKVTDIIESTVRGSEARGLRIRVIMRCRKVTVDQ